MTDTQKFHSLRTPKRLWAVAAIHGELERVIALHAQIFQRFQPGDRLIYLGNYLGRGAKIIETINELLTFRRALLARPGMLADDVIYLRGSQEEMWQKLLQIQFAPNPAEVMQWMMRQGVDATLIAYGGHPDHGLAAAREGAMALTRWTNGLRSAIHALSGHDTLMTALRRAAYTGVPDFANASSDTAHGALLVNAGVDVSRPFGAQGDSFWWGGASFNRITHPFSGFRRVIRGYDPLHGGLQETPFTITIDGGCGFNGVLNCACLTPEGDLQETISV
ncbi:Serine/threonine protein phosphatase [Azospirillaceae bacterium]